MTFRVGQKVECTLNSPWRPQRDLIEYPFYKGIYVIAEIKVCKNDIGLILEEIRNPGVHFTNGKFGEPAFDAKHFRPIVERKTSIEIFTRMLNPSRENMDA